MVCETIQFTLQTMEQKKKWNKLNEFSVDKKKNLNYSF